eukprot:6490972-Amphidinium_carterae.2
MGEGSGHLGGQELPIKSAGSKKTPGRRDAPGGNNSRQPNSGSTTKAQRTEPGEPAREPRRKEATRGTKGNRPRKHAPRANMGGPGLMCRPSRPKGKNGAIECAGAKQQARTSPKTNPLHGTTCRMWKSVKVLARYASLGQQTIISV